MAFSSILSAPIFVEGLLPFLLIFTLVFAILQKTEILGKGKKQIDALVSLSVALIAVAFGFWTNIIVRLMPILAVTAVVILVFMILYGMVFPQGEFKLNKYLSGGIGVVVGIIVIVSVLILSGAWDSLVEYYNSSDSSALLANILFIVIAIVGVGVVVFGGKGSSK